MTDPRLALIDDWLRGTLGIVPDVIVPASADASFRRYFRVSRGAETLIVMDAPPDKEDVEPFLHVARLLGTLGVHAPAVLARDAERGFLLLSDLGSRPYLDALKAGGDADELYADALEALLRMQSRGAAAAAELPPYDAALLHREMELFPEWFLARHLGLEVSPAERAMLSAAFDTLAAAALAQPQVFVHRDYHSRNLMVYPGANPGVIDFQDAVRGALTYDLVSLLKDCYLRLPREYVVEWVEVHRRCLLEAGVEHGMDAAAFLRAFDLMGLQRHIKVLGIFARLWYRDGKIGYIRDLPLVLDYVREALRDEPALAELAAVIEQRVLPGFDAVQARALVSA